MRRRGLSCDFYFDADVTTGGRYGFQNVGPLAFLVPGASAVWNYSYGTDMGPQLYCRPTSSPPGIPSASPVFLADQQRKQRQRNGNATYFVTITNQGPNGGIHNLQGGGLT
jgi:hypothetical protein